MNTERDQQIVRMHRDGMSYREIGRELGISHARVGQIIGKARFEQVAAEAREAPSARVADARQTSLRSKAR